MSAPSTAPTVPGQIVAVANPFNSTWSLCVPGKQWLVAPGPQGHEVLAACVSGADGINSYAIWRVVQSGDSHGVTKLALGRRGQPVSSRVAATLKRFSLLPGAPPGTVAGPGSAAAQEAPVQFQLTPQEIAEFGQSSPSAVLSDAEPVTIDDVGGQQAMVPAMGQVPQGPQPPVEGTPPSILGIPLSKLLVLGGLAYGGYRIYQKVKPARRNRSRRHRDDEDEEDEDEDDEDEDE